MDVAPEQRPRGYWALVEGGVGAEQKEVKDFDTPLEWRYLDAEAVGYFELGVRGAAGDWWGSGGEEELDGNKNWTMAFWFFRLWWCKYPRDLFMY
jgi:hypothetical protein